MTTSEIPELRTFVVPRENLDEIGRCIEAIFQWEPVTRTDDAIGYRVMTDVSKPTIIGFRASEAASSLRTILRRQRAMNPEMDGAFYDWESDPDSQDPFRFTVTTTATWEHRLRTLMEAELRHPEWQIQMFEVTRHTDRKDGSTKICRARIKLGLLGPLRNQIEMLCLA